ncbi:MAG: transporter substrate-binding protein, partial [Paenibacillus sp.]|nr:transporter substrate-binding protein [Paenibacillus sp.]
MLTPYLSSCSRTLLCLILGVVCAMAVAGCALTEKQPWWLAERPVPPTPIQLASREDNMLPSYLGWLARMSNVPDASADRIIGPIHLDFQQHSAVSDPAHFKKNVSGDGWLWDAEDGWVEWEVEVPVEGLYELGIVYDSVSDSGIDMMRGVQINGSYPYTEAEALQLKRIFTHVPYPPARDEFNNDIRPRSEELKGWKDVRLSQHSTSSIPLKWHLRAGKQKIRIVYGRERILLKEIYLTTQGIIPDRLQTSGGQQSTSGEWYQIVEAEQVKAKSNPSILLQSMNAPLMSPETKGLVRFNALGGEQFRNPGEWVEWEVNVPRDGYYQIGFKYLQAYLNNVNVYRKITIDGEVPAQPLLNAAFPYSQGWRWSGMTLKDEEAKPYSFHLKQGKHTIRMTVTSEPIKPVYEGLLRNLDRIGRLEQEIRKVTGNFDKTYGVAGNVDLNRDWDLIRYIPDLDQRMTDMIEDTLDIARYLASRTSGSSDAENSLLSAADDLRDLKENPRTIANRMNVFQKIQNSLSLWTYRMLEQPLAIDYLWVAEQGAKLPKMEPGFLDQTIDTVAGFFKSFVIDYDFTRNQPDAIDVWMNRGRDYVELLRQLADETFTPATGIKVNINLVPDPQMLILGNVAGIQPDVALGVDHAMPVDFASRGALLDLSQFQDYSKAAKQFHPGALNLFHYDKGDYALPEVQGFSVLIYRKDILNRLGISPPDTWDDLTGILPTLQQNGYDFFIPSQDYVPFIYQNKGAFYTEDGMQSALSSESAYRGFEKWTNLFKLYQLPKQVPSFYTHFRLGDIPIGIVDFNTYQQIQFAAPELTGKWAIAPIPGIRNGNGEIERWAGGPVQAGVIFNKTEKADEAWTFLKWWTSTETQTRFGNQIESMYGTEYRWNTANLEAFRGLPWPRKDLEAIQNQWKWFTAVPQVPGGYFTQRLLEFAWNKVVLQGGNEREAYEEAIIGINREMQRKQIEFGLRDSQGQVRRVLDVPNMTVPWEGATR